MLERVRKDGSERRRGAAFLLAFALHVGAVLLLLTAGTAAVTAAHDDGIMIFHMPAAMRHGGGGGEQVKKATPKKIQKKEFEQPQTISTPEVAMATPEPAATPDDSDSTSMPGGPGVGPGPAGPGDPNGTCEGPQCTGDCIGPNCSNDPLDVNAFGVVPTPLFQPQPAYPAVARSAGLNATVVLEIIVGVDGQVKSAQVVSGPSMFVAPALQAVRQWRYVPVVHGGRPIVWKSTVTLKFQLR